MPSIVDTWQAVNPPSTHLPSSLIWCETSARVCSNTRQDTRTGGKLRAAHNRKSHTAHCRITALDCPLQSTVCNLRRSSVWALIAQHLSDGTTCECGLLHSIFEQWHIWAMAHLSNGTTREWGSDSTPSSRSAAALTPPTLLLLLGSGGCPPASKRWLAKSQIHGTQANPPP